MSDILKATIELRQQAWVALQQSPAFAQFRALDEAVVAMGGESALPVASPHLTGGIGHVFPVIGNALAAMGKPGALHTRILNQHDNSLIGRRPSHAEAAYFALVKAGHPMQSAELLEAARREGAKIGGDKPIINLTSTLSRNAGFINLRINGAPHWWLADKPLPYGYVAQDSETLQANIFDEEGGDGDGAALDDIIS